IRIGKDIRITLNQNCTHACITQALDHKWRASFALVNANDGRLRVGPWASPAYITKKVNKRRVPVATEARDNDGANCGRDILPKRSNQLCRTLFLLLVTREKDLKL